MFSVIVMNKKRRQRKIAHQKRRLASAPVRTFARGYIIGTPYVIVSQKKLVSSSQGTPKLLRTVLWGEGWAHLYRREYLWLDGLLNPLGFDISATKCAFRLFSDGGN
jgi:hypothetical protein